MDRAFGLLLRMLKRPPSKKTQEAIAKYDHEVEEGRYHRMLRHEATAKNRSVPHPDPVLDHHFHRETSSPQPRGEGTRNESDLVVSALEGSFRTGTGAGTRG